MAQKIVVIGSGWAGHTFCQDIDDKRFDVTVVSPDSTTPYTPLLASAACGLFNFSLAEEPVRHKKRSIKYMQARVLDVDFEKRSCRCQPAFAELQDNEFDISFDYVIIAPGCITQTFGTPGVAENALFVKNVKDAMALRARLEKVYEMASLPFLTDDRRKALLHVIIVGAGPTGCEVAAELSDLLRDDFSALYPQLRGLASIALHDVGQHILPSFEQKLIEHAVQGFKRSEVEVKTGSHIISVDAEVVHTKEDGAIPYGMLIWATGNKQVPLVDTLKLLKSDRLPRLLTDDRLHPFDLNSTPVNCAFAVGDAADVKGGELPTTAEVACQKGAYLAKTLNNSSHDPFVYSQRAIVAYTGHRDGVVSGQSNWSGTGAWLAWRSKNLDWSGTWRNKILLTMNWSLDHIFGKEIARN